MNRLSKILLLLCVLCGSMTALASERILHFQSDILIEQDGWIEVTETIRVHAKGNRIRRGIYRDFPTEYRDKLGNRYEVDFEPISVLRNNAPENFHSKTLSNGYRVYFGSAQRTIQTGVHTYTFRYRANRMLGFFAEHDELYWNVTGFDWAFPIDGAGASVTLLFNVSGDISHQAYTGPFGAAETNYTSSSDGANRVEFVSTKPLSPTNGMTIVVGWPKGYVAEPTQVQRIGWLLKDNVSLLVGVIGLLVLIGYYIPMWRLYGKDPDQGVIITRYKPPEPYSPASLRYIRQMYYDDKVMTAAIVNLAVKGYIRINVLKESYSVLELGKVPSKHSLSKRDVSNGAPEMAPGEKELFQGLFKQGNTVELDNKNHKLLGAAKRAHGSSLKKDYSQRYFKNNLALNIPALLIVLLTITIANVMNDGVAPMGIFTIVIMGALTIFFAILMRRPTLRGRALLDQMLGFKDYLEVAEKDELNRRNPPDKTPELFEAYLPYALALDVDQEWAEQFSDLFSSISEPGKNSFEPSWYGGRWNTNNFSSTTRQLSTSLNTAISSSVRPPGSSSGSGGGGSSGGGGGGGGGGGW